MRIVLETAPVPAQHTYPNGETAQGTAYFRAILYEANEQTDPPGQGGQPSGQLVSYWRSAVQAGQPLRIPFDGRVPAAPAAFVPVALLASLPADARLQLLWYFNREDSGQ